jgi:flagellar motor switch protein FliN/FliY
MEVRKMIADETSTTATTAESVATAEPAGAEVTGSAEAAGGSPQEESQVQHQERTSADEGVQQESAASADHEPVKKADFQPLSGTPTGQMKADLDLLYDVDLPVSVELGRTSMTIKDMLSVSQGSVITLERAAGEAVDVLVSGKVIGRGEVVVVDDKFGVRITELVNRMDGKAKS